MSELKACPFCGEPLRIINNEPFGGYVIWHHGKDEECPLATDLDGGTAPIQLVYSNRKYLERVLNTRPIEDALQARITELEQAQQWIPVWDKPKKEGWYITLSTMNSVKRSWVEPKIWKGYWESGASLVTHWMPLPTPPEADDEKENN